MTLPKVDSPTDSPENYCNTHAPGWLNAAHPEFGVTLFGATVCHAWGGGTCTFSETIDVTNCGDYYVYNLVGIPWGCNGTYCGED